MKLEQKEYTQIEYSTDGEFSLIGRITMDGDNMVGAEITDSYIMNIEELNNVRKFLDEVEKAMTQTPDTEFEVHTEQSPATIFVRCE